MKLLQIKDQYDLEDIAYKTVLETVQDTFGLEKLSIYKIKKRLFEGIDCKPVFYDCCETGCMAFVGPTSNLENCTHCGKDRFRSRGITIRNGKRVAVKQFPVFDVIKLMQNQFLSKDRVEMLSYRSKFRDNPDYAKDVFGGSLYKEIAEEMSISEDDIVVSAATDGYQIIKMSV